MRVPTRLLALGIAVAALAGCGGNGDEAGPLPEGRHYGYVRSVDTSPSPATITFDLAEFLTGSAANEAAVEDGVIAEGETVPNDYYVRNPDTATVELAVADDVAVTHVQCVAACEERIPGDFDGFAASFSDPEPKSLADEYRGAQSQYWVIVDDGVVAAIDEQYLP